MPNPPGLLDEVKIDLTGVAPKSEKTEAEPEADSPRMSLTANRAPQHFDMEAARAAKLGASYTPSAEPATQEEVVRPTRQQPVEEEPLSSDASFMEDLLNRAEPAEPEPPRRPQLSKQNLGNLTGRALRRVAEMTPAPAPKPAPEEIKEPTPEEMAQSAAELEALMSDLGGETPAPAVTATHVQEQEIVIDDPSFSEPSIPELNIITGTQTRIPVFYEYFTTHPEVQSALKDLFPEYNIRLSMEGVEPGAIYIDTWEDPEPLQLFFLGIAAVLEEGTSHLVNEFGLGDSSEIVHQFSVKV